ncbi:hypothetical protein QQX98_010210 [Neonectria punicea]|uniref:ABC transmembrane type-1 domain-containing protein n=1 Tax=Neonectria punicea TaxID=979145 RepID=A0ABR1GQ55_9HYPO
MDKLRDLEASNASLEFMHQSVASRLKDLDDICNDGFNALYKMIKLVEIAQASVIRPQITSFSRVKVLWTLSSSFSAVYARTDFIRGSAIYWGSVGFLWMMMRPTFFAIYSYRIERMKQRLIKLKHSFAERTIVAMDESDMATLNFVFFRMALLWA